MRRRIAFATLTLLGVVTLALAKDDAAVALATQLVGQAEALHAAAQPPEQGPRPPRFRNWMLRKEVKNLRGLAEQMAVIAGRERAKKFWMRTQQINLELTSQRIRFGIFSGGARHLEGVKPAFDTCAATVKALHEHLWQLPGQGGGQPPPPEAEPPAEEPPPPGAEPPAEEPAPPEAEPPAEEPPPPGVEPPAEEPAPPGAEPPAEEPAPPEAEPPAEQPAPPGAEPPSEEPAPPEAEPPAAS